MKTGSTSAAVVGIAGGIALGMWLASAMTLMDREVTQPEGVVTQQAEARDIPLAEPPAVKTRRVVTPAAAKPAATAKAAATAPVNATAPVQAIALVEKAEAPKLVMTIPVTAPQFHNRIKPVLARGTKINLAVEGFSDAEQFATIAHAARNTQVPFILLKHRVLTEHRSLADAIRASKPDIDADAEVKRARSAAKSDLAALTAN